MSLRIVELNGSTSPAARASSVAPGQTLSRGRRVERRQATASRALSFPRESTAGCARSRLRPDGAEDPNGEVYGDNNSTVGCVGVFRSAAVALSLLPERAL